MWAEINFPTVILKPLLIFITMVTAMATAADEWGRWGMAFISWNFSKPVLGVVGSEWNSMWFTENPISWNLTFFYDLQIQSGTLTVILPHSVGPIRLSLEIHYVDSLYFVPRGLVILSGNLSVILPQHKASMARPLPIQLQEWMQQNISRQSCQTHPRAEVVNKL